MKPARRHRRLRARQGRRRSARRATGTDVAKMGAAPTAELRIALKGDKALCVYGGKVETTQLDRSAAYVMSAETARWVEMGRGDYGPMRAMMFGRLEFVGPKMEAMGNIGPFANFLLLVGKVPGSAQSCPAG